MSIGIPRSQCIPTLYPWLNPLVNAAVGAGSFRTWQSLGAVEMGPTEMGDVIGKNYGDIVEYNMSTYNHIYIYI